MTIFGSIQASHGSLRLLSILNIQHPQKGDRTPVVDPGNVTYQAPSQIVNVIFHPTKTDCRALTIDAEGNVGLFKCNFIDLAMKA